MKVIRHQAVCADIRTMSFSGFSELDEALVNRLDGQERAPITGTCRDKENGGTSEDAIEAAETFFARSCVLGVGGHRPPLQRSGLQPFQQLPVNPVETAVAEDRDHVFLLHKRDELFDDVRGVRFIKRRAS